jgi:hypothetical protein
MIKHLKQKKYGNKPDTEFLYTAPDYFFYNCGFCKSPLPKWD